MGSSIRTSPEPCEEPSGNFGRKIYMREDHEDEGIIFVARATFKQKGSDKFSPGLGLVTENY